MPESVCEELLDELFDNPFLTFADYLSLLRRKRIARGFDYDDLLKPFTFSDQLFESQQRDIVEKFGHVNMLKPPEQAHQYEYVSRAAALRSRQRLFDVSLEDAVLMRIYGTFGRVVNLYTRRHYITNNGELEPSLASSTSDFRNLINRYRLRMPRDLQQKVLKNRANKASFKARFESRTDFSASFTVVADELIRRYSHRFERSGYLFRINEVAPSAFHPESGLRLDGKSIKIGDIITDAALWSASSDLTAVLYRYSNDGEGATKATKPKTSPNAKRELLQVKEDEVLYIIENNENLFSIDISGFKFPPPGETRNYNRHDVRTSAEHLIKSQTPFRVVGIKNGGYRGKKIDAAKTDKERERDRQRKIVILRPIALEDIDFIHDDIMEPYSLEPRGIMLRSRLEIERRRRRAAAEELLAERRRERDETRPLEASASAREAETVPQEMRVVSRRDPDSAQSLARMLPDEG